MTSGDVSALAEALRSVVADADLRCRLSDAASEAAQMLPTWRQSGRSSPPHWKSSHERLLAEWLALRESYDLRARNPIVLDAVAGSFKSLDAISVVDLACGAGSTAAHSAHTCRHGSTGPRGQRP